MVISEHIMPDIKESDTIEVKMQGITENGAFKVIGEITDKIFKNAKFVKSITSHNLVVDSMLILTAALLKGESGYAGITYWAVGSGSQSWDGTPVNPISTETKLTNEIGRAAIAAGEISFLDAQGDPTLTPSNVLQIKHTFGVNDCNGQWREFGLFGGNATSSVDTGQMIDKKHHPVITKTSDMAIERTLKLTLQFI